MMDLRSFFRPGALADYFGRRTLLSAAILLLVSALLALWNPLHAAEVEFVAPDKIFVPDWQKSDDEFVWISLVAVYNDGVTPMEYLDAPDCRGDIRNDDMIAEGVYLDVEGDKPRGIRIRDDIPARTPYCHNTLPITINGETVAWPVNQQVGRRYGIPLFLYGSTNPIETITVTMPKWVTAGSGLANIGTTTWEARTASFTVKVLEIDVQQVVRIRMVYDHVLSRDKKP